MFNLIWFQGHQTQTRCIGHLPGALLLISSPNVDICLSQQSAIFSQRRVRHVGDQCAYQQAVDPHSFVMSAFCGGENKPWTLMWSSLWCYRTEYLLWIVLMHLGYLEYMYICVYACRQLFSHRLCLIDAKQSNKDDVVHRAGCQNPLSIRLCPEHSWILPDICGGISQRTHARGDWARDRGGGSSRISALLLAEESWEARRGAGRDRSRGHPGLEL